MALQLANVSSKTPEQEIIVFVLAHHFSALAMCSCASFIFWAAIMLIDQLGYEEYVIDKRLWMSLRRCLDYQELLLGRNVTNCRRLRMPHWTKKQQQQRMRKSGSSTVMQLENLLFVFLCEKLYNQIHNSTFLGGNIPSVHHHSGFLNVIFTPSL